MDFPYKIIIIVLVFCFFFFVYTMLQWIVHVRNFSHNNNMLQLRVEYEARRKKKESYSQLCWWNWNRFREENRRNHLNQMRMWLPILAKCHFGEFTVSKVSLRVLIDRIHRYQTQVGKKCMWFSVFLLPD